MKFPWSKKESKDALVPENKTKISKTFISIDDTYGSSPSITLTNQVDAFEKDPILRESIIHTSMEILGTGFFTSIDDKYTVVLPKPNSVGVGNWTAKEALDYWNTENNLDEVLLTCSLELVAYGNSFLLLTANGIQPIPLTSISTLDNMSKTIPKTEQYKIVFNNIANQREALWGSFVHFRANVTTDTNPFGTGVVAGLLEKWDTNCDSLMDQVYMIRKAMTAGFGAFSQPTQVWVFPKASDTELGTKKTEIEKLPQYGGRFATNEEMSIIGPMPNKERGYDEFIKTMFDQYIMSIGDPSLKASVESGFTEASIRGSIELYRKKIQYMRRTLKRQVEKMWATVLKGYGFDPDAAQAKLNFGADEIAWTVSDLMNAVSNGVITPEEARVQLMKKAKWELDEKAPAPKPIPKEEPKQ